MTPLLCIDFCRFSSTSLPCVDLAEIFELLHDDIELVREGTLRSYCSLDATFREAVKQWTIRSNWKFVSNWEGTLKFLDLPRHLLRKN